MQDKTDEEIRRGVMEAEEPLADDFETMHFL
jgi:hypothetical protein